MSKTIYTHKHHKIPRHAGGSDDPSNIVELTIEEHALAHKKLFFIYGRWQDEVAWKSLLGEMKQAERVKRLRLEGAKKGAIMTAKNWPKGTRGQWNNGMRGKKHTPETLKKISEASSGENNANFGGVLQTPEVKKKMSVLKKGSKNNQWGKHWYNNGIENVVCFEHEVPEGYTRGRINGNKPL